MTHHRRGLRRLLEDDELADALETDHRSAPVDPKRRAMLDHVAKLTLTPSKMSREDHERLISAGFSDEDVLALTEVAAYYAYVNRIASGLGVGLES